MSSKAFLGTAPAVAQVTDYTFGGTWEADDIVIPLIGTKSASIAAGSTVTNTAVDNVVTAWNALSSTTYQEFAEITASRSSSNLRLTGDTAGKPFTETNTTTEANGGAADAQTIAAASAVTACSGPNHWDTAANWTTAATPVNSDDITLENSTVDILYGLAQSAVALASLSIYMTFTGDIGLPRTNADGTEYAEYRATYLAIGATTINVGLGEGTGSERIKIDSGTAVVTLNQFNSGAAAETGIEAVLWKGTHVWNVVNVYAGTLGVARFSGETAVIATLRVQGTAQVYCGSGVTLTDITIGDSSRLRIASAFTTLSMTGPAFCLIEGSGAAAAISVDDGTVDYRSSGTISDLSVASGATIDFSNDDRPKIVTDCTAYAGATINDPDGVVTFTNGITCLGCRPDEVRFIGPKGCTIVPILP